MGSFNILLDHYLAVEALKTAKDIHAQNQTSWFYSSITEIFDYFKMKKNKDDKKFENTKKVIRCHKLTDNTMAKRKR